MKILISVVLLLGVGCTCTLEKRSLDQLESNVKRHQADHKALMTKANRPAEDVKDWDKHYEATFHLIDALKESAK